MLSAFSQENLLYQAPREQKHYTFGISASQELRDIGITTTSGHRHHNNFGLLENYVAQTKLNLIFCYKGVGNQVYVIFI